jgi:hypothetical protein
MASPRPWPFDDDDRPSGSVRPLSQADLQAILAHLDEDPDELLYLHHSAGRDCLVELRTPELGSLGRRFGQRSCERSASWPWSIP